MNKEFLNYESFVTLALKIGAMEGSDSDANRVVAEMLNKDNLLQVYTEMDSVTGWYFPAYLLDTDAGCFMPGVSDVLEAFNGECDLAHNYLSTFSPKLLCMPYKALWSSSNLEHISIEDVLKDIEFFQQKTLAKAS